MIICRYQWCISGHLFFDLRLCVFVCSGRFPPLWKCVIAVRADTVTSYYVGNVCVLSHCLWTLSTALNTPIVYCSFLYFCCCDRVLRLVRYISLDIINFCNSSLDFMVMLSCISYSGRNFTEPLRPLRPNYNWKSLPKSFASFLHAIQVQWTLCGLTWGMVRLICVALLSLDLLPFDSFHSRARASVHRDVDV